MRSIFAKVVLWSLGTFVVSLVAFWGISHALDHRGPGPGRGDLFAGLHAMIEDDARLAYERGGPEALAAVLRRIDEHLPGEHLLTDDRGRDLVSGADRSDLLVPGSRYGGPPRLPDGRHVFIPPPRGDGGRYRFIAVIPPWPDRPNILPYYGAIVLVIAGMGAILAANLATPLRRLRRVVDRFGEGDLSARVGSTRRDEIGELSRSFDAMAGRIETLLAAERRLLQDVSHELRSPLTRLRVAVEMASTGGDPGPALVRMERDIGRLTLLVNELLQLTRAEGDPSALVVEPIRLDELLRELVDEHAPEAGSRGVRLELDAGPARTVDGDRELVRRAVENVVRNAIRHAPEGTAVSIGVRAEGSEATIDVRDRGPGVPDDLLTAIFEPFFRVDGHRSRASGGIGLGLAIARRAAALHRGLITARNADPGLAVEIRLPAREG